jgi:hypothetical protein
LILLKNVPYICPNILVLFNLRVMSKLIDELISFVNVVCVISVRHPHHHLLWKSLFTAMGSLGLGAFACLSCIHTPHPMCLKLRYGFLIPSFKFDIYFCLVPI